MNATFAEKSSTGVERADLRFRWGAVHSDVSHASFPVEELGKH